MEKSGKKFKMTLVKGGGDSFCGALRNSRNNIDVGVDEALFSVDEDGIHENEKMDENKYLFLLSGAAGSGKSTMAEMLQSSTTGLIEPIADICEADEFWYILGKGKYAFKPMLLPKAHKWCQNQAKEIMQMGLNLIVSNTNLFPRDRKPYFDMADEFGYKVVFIHLDTQYKNVHNVPDEVVKRMKDKYTPLNDWEKERVVKSEEMSEGLSKLLKKVGANNEF